MARDLKIAQKGHGQWDFADKAALFRRHMRELDNMVEKRLASPAERDGLQSITLFCVMIRTRINHAGSDPVLT